MTLRAATEAAGIVHAHIVDDAFDVEPGAGLAEAAIHAFLAEVDEEQFDALAIVLGIDDPDEDKVVAHLRTQEGAAALYAKRDAFGAPAEQLFLEFSNVVGPEKNLLDPLITVLEGMGVNVHKFGRDYILNGEPKPQMLFVDLKLTEGQIRIEEPIDVVRKMRKIYGDAHPLVFLMSSHAGSLRAEREKFREHAKLFSSQFEDIPKRKFAHAKVLERFLWHHVQVYRQIVALQRHVEAWSGAMDMAKERLEETLRGLDLADYFVLRNTASADGMKLGGYVTDLLLEYVAHEIEGRPQVGRFARELDGWDLKSLTRSRFSIEPVVADIFAANVLHSADRLEWEKKNGLGPSNGMLSMGDVFFRRDEVNAGAIRSAVVVLQPACDLVRPAILKSRKQTILVCHGKVSILKPSSALETVDNLDPVILRYPPLRDTRHVLEWDKKRSFHWEHTMLDELAKPEAALVHVGRLQPLYALQLQRAVTADLSRVGTQRRPFQYVPYGVQLLVPKNGKWQTIVDHGADASSGAISDDRGDHKKTFILNDVLLREAYEKLEDWLAGNLGQPAAAAIRAVLDYPQALSMLMYHVSETSKEARGRPVYPLDAAAFTAGQEALKKYIVLAVQRSEDSHFASGRNLKEGETAVIVFKFVRAK